AVAAGVLDADKTVRGIVFVADGHAVGQLALGAIAVFIVLVRGHGTVDGLAGQAVAGVVVEQDFDAVSIGNAFGITVGVVLVERGLVTECIGDAIDIADAVVSARGFVILDGAGGRLAR